MEGPSSWRGVAFILAVCYIIHHADRYPLESLRAVFFDLEARVGVARWENGRESRELGKGEDATRHDNRLVDRWNLVRSGGVGVIAVAKESGGWGEGMRRGSKARDGVR
ncbi:hypothetical protein HG530_002245 [Fusarium avenaceum]|nr:hypothetical protein HG530_002245 [Fusarium avenaceum]